MLIKIDSFENDEREYHCIQLSIPEIHGIGFSNVSNMEEKSCSYGIFPFKGITQTIFKWKISQIYNQFFSIII